MGTNYYLFEKPPCSECARPFERKHIGKSSAGWCFTLHVAPEDGINDLDDWRLEFAKPGVTIKDEYGTEVDVDGMICVITERSWSRRYKDNFDYAGNHAEPGPNGLVRHRLDCFCVKHGSGTWDCVLGEFS